jgi:hypothetical protein
MSIENRLFYIWCVLIGVIFLTAILSGGSLAYQKIAAYDANRWIHFLAYAAVATVPIAVSKPRTRMLLAFLPPVICIALEFSQAHLSGPLTRAQNVPADFFGLAAGVLLGLNIRVMRNSSRPLDHESSNPSSSEMY